MPPKRVTSVIISHMRINIAGMRRILCLTLTVWMLSWLALVADWGGAVLGWGSFLSLGNDISALGISWQTLALQKWIAVACGCVLIFTVRPALPQDDEAAPSSNVVPLISSDVSMQMTALSLAGMLSALLLVHGVAEAVRDSGTLGMRLTAVSLTLFQAACIIALGRAVRKMRLSV